MAAEKTTRPRSCRRTKASRQAGLSGAKFAPVIATSRPPSAKPRQRRGDMAQGGVGHAADRHWPAPRTAGSSARRSADAGIEMIVDLGGVEARDGNAGKETAEQPGAASRPAR